MNKLASIAFSFSILSFSSGLSLADDKVTFVDNVKPIFQKRCTACHNGNRQSGGLDLTNFTNMMQGGSSGTSIEPGDASGSYLLLLVNHEESPEMPPDGGKIPDAEIEMITRWIEGGALENKTSVAKTNKKKSFAMTTAVGVRPEKVASPWRMPLEPHHRTDKAGIVNSLAISPWTSLVAMAGSKQIMLYDSSSLDVLGFLPTPEGTANDIKFSRDGSVLIAGGGRHGLAGKVIAWDVSTASRLFEIGDELDNVLAADISANLGLVALGGPQKMLRVYSTDSESPVYEIKKHTDWITEIAFSPDGVLLASADRNGGLQLWEAESGNEYLTLAGHGKSITGISWRSDSNVVATCSDDGTVKLWEVENGRQIKSWAAHNSVTGIDFTRDGKLVTTGRDATVKLWQQDGKVVRQYEELGESGISIAFCNEMNRIFASNFAGQVKVWQMENPKTIGACDANPLDLASRLQLEEQKVVSIGAKLQPVAKDFAAIETRFKELQAEIQSQNELRSGLAAELDSIRTHRQSLESKIAENQKRRDSLAKITSQSEKAEPVVAATLEKATEASQILTADPSLLEVVASLQKKQQAVIQTVIDGKKELANVDANQAALNSEFSATTKTITDKKSQLSGTDQRLTQLQTDLEPVQKKLEQLKKQVNTLQNQIETHRSKVVFWTGEIQFAKELINKSNQLKTAIQSVNKKDQQLANVQERLKSVQAEFQQTQSEKAKLEANAAAIQSAIREFRKRKE